MKSEHREGLQFIRRWYCAG